MGKTKGENEGKIRVKMRVREGKLRVIEDELG